MQDESSLLVKILKTICDLETHIGCGRANGLMSLGLQHVSKEKRIGVEQSTRAPRLCTCFGHLWSRKKFEHGH